MTDFLTELSGDLLAAELRRGRSAQVETGASQVFGCRAEAVLRLNGAPQEPSLSWAAWVGSAMHERLAVQTAADGRVLEQRFTYRGVPATVDRYDDKTVTDYKSKGDAGDVAAVRRDGPSRKHRAQVHLGAAALIEAGHEVTTVRLVYLPREGSLGDGWVFAEPFDRSMADEAAEWVEKTNALAQERQGLDVDGMADGLRDEPPSFCRAYCPFASVCRGEPVAAPVVDEGVADVAAEYLEACKLAEEAESRKKKARAFLESYPLLESVGLRWQGGGTKQVSETDLEKVLAEYEFIVGPVPTRTVEKTSARQLRRTS